MKNFSKKFAKSKIVLTFATRLGNEPNARDKFIDIIERRNIEVKTKHKKDSL